MCDVLSMIKRCEVWNIARVDGNWAGRKVLFVVYVAKMLRWNKVHYKLAMGGAAQVAMCVASQIWQVVFASQTLQVFCLALRKKAQYVVVLSLAIWLWTSFVKWFTCGTLVHVTNIVAKDYLHNGNMCTIWSKDTTLYIDFKIHL